MAFTRKIVCLAASRKPGGRCIAGKQIGPGDLHPWVRPVSSRLSHEISLSECRPVNGGEPRLLDLLAIPTLTPAPHLHQIENELIDEHRRWTRLGTVPWNLVPTLLDTASSLWSNGHSTHAGLNDRVPAPLAINHPGSLRFIQPEDLYIAVHPPRDFQGEPKPYVRALFNYQAQSYNIAVTDPVVERHFSLHGENIYPIAQPAYLTVSLGEVHTDGFCYKLVAAIICENGFSEAHG
jgi:hypothetical protein